MAGEKEPVAGTAKTADTAQLKTDKDLIGIGGWLIFFQLFAGFVMFTVISILRYSVTVSTLRLPDIFGLLILVSLIVCLALFYARKKLFRIFVIVFAALFVANMVFDNLLGDYGAFTNADWWIIGAITAVMALIVFSLYFSRRVKNTFDPLKSTSNKEAEKALYLPHKQFAGKWMSLVIFITLCSVIMVTETYYVLGDVHEYYYLAFIWCFPCIGVVLLAVQKMKALRVFCIFVLCVMAGLILADTIILLRAMSCNVLWLFEPRWPIVDIVILAFDIALIAALLFSRRVKNMFVPRLAGGDDIVQTVSGKGEGA